MTDSLELIARMQGGDRDALDVLLRQHLPALRGYVRLHSGELLRNKEASTDLVQSVCREVLTNMERFQYPSESGFRRWLFTTARRKIRDRYDYYLAARRDAGLEQPMQPEDQAQAALLDCYRSFCTPSAIIAEREQIERIEQTFDRLSEDHREVILLAYVVGLPRAEIAEQMGRSEGAVRTLLHRALARLTELVGPEA